MWRNETTVAMTARRATQAMVVRWIRRVRAVATLLPDQRKADHPAASARFEGQKT
ncbi:hypothetical protein [Streptosporangium sp. NPDC049376]|uniref:hypothetical protein n=1 Tax=Streptosporangium sp. NPDC049376 TaxID=3366192 RepID=UPI003797F077